MEQTPSPCAGTCLTGMQKSRSSAGTYTSQQHGVCVGHQDTAAQTYQGPKHRRGGPPTWLAVHAGALDGVLQRTQARIKAAARLNHTQAELASSQLDGLGRRVCAIDGVQE